MSSLWIDEVLAAVRNYLYAGRPRIAGSAGTLGRRQAGFGLAIPRFES